MTRATALRRRDLIATGMAAAGVLAFGPGFWRRALAAPAEPGPGPYGPLQPADAHGLELPAGFSAREIARGNEVVPGTTYPWHVYSDGQATFGTDDGGWILVSNSESLAATGAGSSAVRFNQDASIADAYRILAGTNANCAGGPTPWATWLSCEEHEGGQVWECDPAGFRPAVNRPAMGVFQHEAVAVDPQDKRLYMTEDRGDGGFYRFTPTAYPDLSTGSLEVAVVAAGGDVTWVQVPDPSALGGTPTRRQVANMTKFNGGEGIWFDSDWVYFSTKGDDKVHAYDTVARRLEVIYDKSADAQSMIDGPDNLTVSPFGDLFVCEDNGALGFEIVIVTPDRQVAPFVRFSGSAHRTSDGRASETAGVVFDPSGKRLYFASQRAHDVGAVYEVTGPFRLPSPAGVPPPTSGQTPPGGGGGDQPSGGGQTPPAGGGGDDASGGGTAGGAQGEPPTPVVTPPPPVTTRRPAADTREDVDAPGLRITAARAVSLRTLALKGISVRVRIDEPATVSFALRSTDLASEPGRRGSVRRPLPTTLASARARYDRAGTFRATLKIHGRAEKLLHGRGRVRGRLIVQARDRRRNVAIANRRVRIVGTPAQRRALKS